MNTIEEVSGKKPSAESERLAAFFDTLESGKIEFLNTAGKRLVELCTALLGILFGIIAFGDKFPPPYLIGNDLAKICVLVAALCFLLAMIAGCLVFFPRFYKHPTYDLKWMNDELGKMVNDKVFWFRFGSVLFGTGCVSLTILIGAIILRVP